MTTETLLKLHARYLDGFRAVVLDNKHGRWRKLKMGLNEKKMVLNRKMEEIIHSK